MPGLIGAIGLEKNHPLDLAIFQQMLELVSHRPWYQQDIYIDDAQSIALSRIHLNILDQDKQPYLYNNDMIKIFMYGEIFNDEVANSHPIDFIADRYGKLGADFVKHLNGSFIIVIIDDLQDCIIIANDRTATRPLFYFSDGKVLYFASELKALLRIPSLRKEISQAAVASFLTAGYYLNGLTLIEDINTLDNASILYLKNGQISFRQYWNYTFEEAPMDRGWSYYQKILAELLHVAVKRRTRTDHRYGILLSGGYDSRGILGCYLEAQKDQAVTTISWGRTRDIPYSDCAVAQHVADTLGTNHIFYQLNPEGFPQHLYDFVYLHDGLTDACGNYPESVKIFQRIREELAVQIILRGDECFGWVSTAFDQKSVFKTLGIENFEDLDCFRPLFRDDNWFVLRMVYQQLLDDISSRCHLKELHNRKDFFYLDQRLRYYLNPLNSLKSVEVEVRNPYIDNDILDFVSKLPVRYRKDKALYKRTVKQMFRPFFSEVAIQSDAIDWNYSIKQSSILREFFRQEFSKGSFILDSLLKDKSLDNILHNITETRQKNSLKSFMCLWGGKYPNLYHGLKQKYMMAQRRWSNDPATISYERLMFRLLTLRIWESLFLS